MIHNLEKHFQDFPLLLYFTILIHGEVSNDNGCGVSWRDEGYTRGGCIATGHRHWIAWGDAAGAGVEILSLSLSFFGFPWWGRGRGGSALLLQLLQLEGSDVNHRVGVDLSLGGGPGDCLWRVQVIAGLLLAFTPWESKQSSVME